MAFQVCSISSSSQLDSLPVAKIISYPLEQRDYKPYAQNNICLLDDRLVLRLWAFEARPAPGSMVRGVFYLFGDSPDTALSVTATAAGETVVQLLRGGVEQAPLTLPESAVVRDHSGEDLQGIYWGRLAELPLDWLGTLAGPVNLTPGQRFGGNFYKLCEEPGSVHKGCFAPADFAGDDAFGPGSMGEFEVVSY